MSTRDMDDEITHAILRPTPQFGAERLGRFNGAKFPLKKERFVPLTSMMIVLDPESKQGYRANPTGEREAVDGDMCRVYHLSPEPVQVEQ